MNTSAPTAPIVLDATAIEDLPIEQLGDLPGVRHRVLSRVGVSMTGVLTIDAGHQLGGHAHRRHQHHIWVLEGEARILGHDLGPGSYVYVPVGVDHDIDARATDGCSVFYQYLLLHG